jgi:hypothetical protein
MQQKKEERRQTEDTTTAYLKSKSIAKRYQYTNNKNILAQLVDSESGYCLQCGLVHGFTNIEGDRRSQNNNNGKCLDRLFWEAAL